MDKDFSEIIEYLDKKFSSIDEKFAGIDGKFSNIDEKFSKIDQKLIELDEGMKDIREMMVTKEEFNDLQTSVDAYAKKADTYFQEMVMLAHKVDRHEKWFQQIADKIGIKLEY
ncbi:MAG: hypothetical protein HYT20_00970 [Candidatus Nealsonbacteria bacterium]|nr:hypothetical protein [Candidatus Nealsonbacteria bacterium]